MDEIGRVNLDFTTLFNQDNATGPQAGREDTRLSRGYCYMLWEIFISIQLMEFNV